MTYRQLNQQKKLQKDPPTAALFQSEQLQPIHSEFSTTQQGDNISTPPISVGTQRLTVYQPPTPSLSMDKFSVTASRRSKKGSTTQLTQIKWIPPPPKKRHQRWQQ